MLVRPSLVVWWTAAAVAIAHDVEPRGAGPVVPVLVHGKPGAVSSVGLHPIAPGWAAGDVASKKLGLLARAHPDLDYQLAKDVHVATDEAVRVIGVPEVETAGLTGKGAVVGVVDTGLDVRHPAFRDAQGHTRVAWLLDYSRRPRGKHPELEARFARLACSTRAAGGVSADGTACVEDGRCPPGKPCASEVGAIYSREDLDALLHEPAQSEPVPTDEVGHGTHVAAIAAGSVVAGSSFRGVAPEASIVVVKGGDEGLAFPQLSVTRGVEFIFDRAALLGLPAAINLSIADPFAARDGTDAFAEALAAQASSPGRVIVAAAGNRGDPADGAHQAAYVADGETVRIAVEAPALRDARAKRPLAGSPEQGEGDAEVKVLVLPHPGADIRVGIDSPEGRWVSPVGRGRTRSARLGGAVANVVFDPNDFRGEVSPRFSGALVTWAGGFSPGTYEIVLEGSGVAELWISGQGSFTRGVRERTIASPAMHPGIIAVGATVSRTSWRTMGGETLVLREGTDVLGPIATFSASGPGLGGELKPDLLAPGVAVVAAASAQYDRTKGGMFGEDACPSGADGSPQTRDPNCAFVDPGHAVSTGTSMSAPLVTGAAALLLEADPNLSQAEMRAVLMAGVHRHRPGILLAEQASAGELDVPGSVAVLRRLRAPQAFAPPARERSWLSVNSRYVQADGTRPLVALFHLRTPKDDPADGFGPDRFRATVAFDNRRAPAESLERLAPGLWEARFTVPGRLATRSVTIEGHFDDSAVVDPRTLPVSLDPWQAQLPSAASGGTCGVAGTAHRNERQDARHAPVFVLLLLVLASARRSRSRTLGMRG